MITHLLGSVKSLSQGLTKLGLYRHLAELTWPQALKKRNKHFAQGVFKAVEANDLQALQGLRVNGAYTSIFMGDGTCL